MAFNLLFPAYDGEDYTDTITIPADITGWSFDGTLFFPGTDTNTNYPVTVTITNAPDGVVAVAITGQELYAGEWPLTLYRTDTGSRTCCWTGLLCTTAFPSPSGS